ncbi:MAG TPA: type I glyceraldehyde-3-phosphate dehydrogenase [Candidatus Polarisedimenticolia bacterium]|nr:type I glyceraldehyde-3-phosphate dehydrogenase [Candidatus Polarisedimenticolia bacterium]
MAARVAINGFGRIGRMVLRAAKERRLDVDFVAINDVADLEPLGMVLRHDSIHGRYPGSVEWRGTSLIVDGDEIRVFKVGDKRAGDPFAFPWHDLNVDVVVESSGQFRRRDELQRHLDAGAKRVVLTVPGKDPLDATIVLGVNDDTLRPEDRIISNSSCTTNCAAPIAKILEDAYTIRKGFLTTVHAYTNDQRLFDYPHKDMRRGRMAAVNIVPTSTGAARALGLVVPSLLGKVEGLAFRVPVPSGSVVDLTVYTERKAQVEEIHELMRRAADGPMRGILKVSTDPIVSADVIGDPHSAIYDAPLTQVLGDRMTKVVAWYDNEWAYAMRVAEMLPKVAAL